MNMINKQRNIGKSVAFIFSLLTAIIYTVFDTIIRFSYSKGLGDTFDFTMAISCIIIFCVTIHIQIKKYLEASVISAVILTLLTIVGYRLSIHFHGGDLLGNLSLILAFFYFFASLVVSWVIGIPFYFIRMKKENST